MGYQRDFGASSWRMEWWHHFGRHGRTVEGSVIVRPMMRCATCKRWWSGEPINGEAQHCPCGGKLEVADMEAHMASLPKKIDTPAEVEELRLQKERAAAKAAK